MIYTITGNLWKRSDSQQKVAKGFGRIDEYLQKQGYNREIPDLSSIFINGIEKPKFNYDYKHHNDIREMIETSIEEFIEKIEKFDYSTRDIEYEYVRRIDKTFNINTLKIYYHMGENYSIAFTMFPNKYKPDNGIYQHSWGLERMHKIIEKRTDASKMIVEVKLIQHNSDAKDVPDGKDLVKRIKEIYRG